MIRGATGECSQRFISDSSLMPSSRVLRIVRGVNRLSTRSVNISASRTEGRSEYAANRSDTKHHHPGGKHWHCAIRPLRQRRSIDEFANEHTDAARDWNRRTYQQSDLCRVHAVIRLVQGSLRTGDIRCRSRLPSGTCFMRAPCFYFDASEVPSGRRDLPRRDLDSRTTRTTGLTVFPEKNLPQVRDHI
jgi:hypothetical protein